MHACNITFTGGEPFVKEGFYELLKYASTLNMYTNVCTNGVIFNEENYDNVLNTGIDGITFSLNSIEPHTHNHYKGIESLHRKVVSAIQYIKKKKHRPQIGVLCMITKDTYRSLDDFVQWVYDLGVDSIDFTPVSNIHQPDLTPVHPSFLSNAKPFSEIDDFKEFDKQIDLLISRKKHGFPIMMSIEDLRALKIYFRDVSKLSSKYRCDIGFRNLFIAYNGDVQLCLMYPPVGNVRKDTIKKIWFSEKAQQQRMEMLKCKKPCLAACMRRYAISEKILHFLIRARLKH
jgi:MoaA/NifB/PqqE/SkfB family radical SAM enzyme